MPINFSELIETEILKLKREPGKFQYGISTYPENPSLIRKLLKTAKTTLKENGVSSRYLNQDNNNLSSIMSANCEEINLVFGKKTYMTKTVATQDIESYGFRDYERPARDDRSGMLPPKLAQIMINLANPEKDTVIYDPFCGSGTVLQESLMMGFDTAGTDISEKAVRDSKTNLEWVTKNFQIGKTCLKLELKDATKLTTSDYSFDGRKIAIVAESYLGEPQKDIPTPEKAHELLQKLEPIYLNFLKTPIPTGTRIVLALPFFNLKPNPVYLEDLIYKVRELGYIIPAHESDILYYARRKQVVGRMILRLTKQ
jgi:tRNA G10  N-methylase Trm11